VSAPVPPGWYRDPSGEPGRLFWDGWEWHTAVPAAHRHGGPNLVKVVVGVGLLALVGTGAIGIAAGWLNGQDRGSTATTSAGPDTPAPTTTSRYLSDKTMPSDGVYKVGGDQVDPGVWESAGPTDNGATRCVWARLSAPQQTVENTIEAGGSDSGPARARISGTDAAFSTHGCQPWRLVAK